MDMPNIEAIDRFFPPDIAKFVSDFCLYSGRYRYGEKDNEVDDNPNDPRDPTGMVHDIFNLASGGDFPSNENKMVYDCFIKGIRDKYPKFWDEFNIYRMYINVFAPREQAYFHEDCDDHQNQHTFLYYPVHDLWEYNIEQGGETQFYVDRKIIGVPPYFNSLVRFNSRLLHKATSFRDHHRFTIAIKCATPADIKQGLSDLSSINGKL